MELGIYFLKKALYCIPRAIHSLFEKFLNYKKMILKKKRIDAGVYCGTIIFSISLALMIYCMEFESGNYFEFN
jgi:hypothetical protein